MGSSSAPSRAPVSPEFRAVFAAAAAADGTLPFARFMELALFHPQVGYYRRAAPRIGRTAGTDFYTASTSGPVFGELVAAAAAKLLRVAGRDPAAHTFVEIGAETAGGVLAGVAHPFAAARTVRLGEDDLPPAGDCVVFSNELFDAQPCVRVVFRGGRWRELGVRLDGDALAETELPGPIPADWPLPAESPEGFHLDLPFAARDLLARLARPGWRGLFVAFDYGKTWRELTEATPAGTARAYRRHTQSNDLLACPGEQDLTCHICWDWMSDTLRALGFADPALQTQESFLIRHAGEVIAAASAADAAGFSARKLSLLQLVHPSHMGQKFQVLHAVR